MGGAQLEQGDFTYMPNVNTHRHTVHTVTDWVGGGASAEGAYSHEVGPLDLTPPRTQTTQLQTLFQSILPFSPGCKPSMRFTLCYQTSLKVDQTTANEIWKRVAEMGGNNTQPDMRNKRNSYVKIWFTDALKFSGLESRGRR